MKHPFSLSEQNITELEDREIEAVSGGLSKPISLVPGVTTYAVGEEGGIRPIFPPKIKPPKPPGGATTLAIGEEGGISFPRW